MPKALVHIPKLKHGRDAQRAEELTLLISEAADGLRRIIKVGFFIECIAADLPHGQLMAWVAANCPKINYRTVSRWRDLAGNVGEIIGLSFEQRTALKTPLHELLSLPAAQVPKELRSVREKIDAEIDGKSCRQLFLEFKNAKQEGEDFRPATGAGKFHPRKQVLTPEQKASALVKEQRALQAANQVALHNWCETGQAIFQDAFLGMADAADLARVVQVLDLGTAYVRQLAQHRAHAPAAREPARRDPTEEWHTAAARRRADLFRPDPVEV
jgi:hypothetical protein